MFPAWFVTKARQYGMLAQKYRKRFDAVMEQQALRAKDEIVAQKLDDELTEKLVRQVDSVYDLWYQRFAPPAVS